MNIKDFGYRGLYSFAPPLVSKGAEDQLLVISTAFGNSEELEPLIAEFIAEVEKQLADPECTNPFPKLTSLNIYENILYTAIQFLNQSIYRENKEQIRLACDFFCALKIDSALYFCQVGWPLFLSQQEQKVSTLSSSTLFTPQDLDQSGYIPSELMGLDQSLHFKIQCHAIQKEESFYLIKSNSSPKIFLTDSASNLKEKAKALSQINPEQGFWISEIKTA